MKGIAMRKDHAILLSCYLSKAAAQNHVKAQIALGNCHRYGIGVPKDVSEARSWYRRATDMGSPEAAFTLGLMYRDGREIPQNYAEAAKWYRQAAERGNADAQLVLGGLCYEGKGVPQDYSQAFGWSLKAAEQGNACAQYYVGLMCAYERSSVQARICQDNVQTYVRGRVWGSSHSRMRERL
jgi:TPR repeat protein